MKSIFNLNKESLKDLPFNVHLEADDDLNDDSFKEKAVKTHVISDNIIVFEEESLMIRMNTLPILRREELQTR